VFAVYQPLGFGKDKLAVTEFGWPRQPEGFRETNVNTGQPCVGGEAGNVNHDLVIGDTFRLLDQAGYSAHMFALAIERWKPEPNVGGSWGDCEDTPPYACRFPGYLKMSADLLRPVPGSTLEGTSPTFVTSKGAGNGLAKWLDVGTSFGSGDLFAGIIQNESQVVSNLPCDGRTLFVRLWTRVDGVWRSPFDYRLKACTDNRARLQIPVAASALLNDLQQFSWFAATGAAKYWLDVGTIQRQGNIFGGETTATQVTVTNLPCDGRTLYASLWTFRNGAWEAPVDYVFTACNDGRSRVWLPVRGSTFPQGPVQIQWFGLTGAQAYWLDLGNSVGSGDIFGNLVTGTQAAINNVPCDGRNLFVRLWTRVGGVWRAPVDYQYKACSGGGSGPVKAVISSPTPGSGLSGTVTFTWTAPQGASKYWLDVGCAVGQGTIFARELTGVSQSVPGTSCGPGKPIYVRLWTYSGSAWLSPVDFSYQSL
jgi:hypothetical protein